ncbi:MAG: hypothetical protein KIS76_19360, partial [Pyrinomonadaceae bacterium]|nr:hypothetical protein [Pyrinomonadaceae bacterium]
RLLYELPSALADGEDLTDGESIQADVGFSQNNKNNKSSLELQLKQSGIRLKPLLSWLYCPSAKADGNS